MLIWTKRMHDGLCSSWAGAARETCAADCDSPRPRLVARHWTSSRPWGGGCLRIPAECALEGMAHSNRVSAI